jgi:glycosyltransferase involved in cell wall biosynthesis
MVRGFLLFLLFISSAYAGSEKAFVVLIPSYNNAEWYQRNLNSVFSQNYSNYRVIYIDDQSQDGTGELVRAYIQMRHLSEKISLICNEERVGALANIYRAVHMCSPDEIIVSLDGDDWLAHSDVLSYLNGVYSDPDVWLTYGQFVYYPSYQEGFSSQVPDHVIAENSFRSFGGAVTHLKTFYAGLFQQIQKKDLLYEGKFCAATYDLAIMLPMLEMAGYHSRFTPEVTYVYNVHNPINDHKVRQEEQERLDRFLRSKEKYSPIETYQKKIKPKKVYITPGFWVQLFAQGDPNYDRDNCLEVTCRLRDIAAKEGIEILQADSLEIMEDFDYLVVFDIFLDQLPYLARFPKEKLILFLWEPPSVLPENFNLEHHAYFSKIFTWDDTLVDNEKYFKFHYAVLRPMIEDVIEFPWKRFATMIACNKESSYPGELYTARRAVIDFFEELRADDFDLYGKWWPHSLHNYQGRIDKKVDVLKFYKFSYAYENVKNIPGYVSEKIFDCFQAGAVPIYWGAPNIENYVPRNCFIHRKDFPDEASLYHYLKQMDEGEYLSYIDNIRAFLQSEQAQLFSIDRFIHHFINLIQGEP